MLRVARRRGIWQPDTPYFKCYESTVILKVLLIRCFFFFWLCLTKHHTAVLSKWEIISSSCSFHSSVNIIMKVTTIINNNTNTNNSPAPLRSMGVSYLLKETGKHFTSDPFQSVSSFDEMFSYDLRKPLGWEVKRLPVPFNSPVDSLIDFNRLLWPTIDNLHGQIPPAINWQLFLFQSTWSRPSGTPVRNKAMEDGEMNGQTLVLMCFVLKSNWFVVSGLTQSPLCNLTRLQSNPPT